MGIHRRGHRCSVKPPACACHSGGGSSPRRTSRLPYENYRRVVQLLLWKHPVDPDGFLVLKAPQIGGQIAAFADVFPEADFVITDRDPFRCLVSMAVMGESIIEPFCIDNPLTNDGTRDRLVLSWIRPKLAALSAFSAAAPERVTHVAYPALVERPEGNRAAYAARPLAFPSTRTWRAGSTRSCTHNAPVRRAAPPPELATMGYTHDDVLSDPTISDYCRTFGITPNAPGSPELNRRSDKHDEAPALRSSSPLRRYPISRVALTRPRTVTVRRDRDASMRADLRRVLERVRAPKTITQLCAASPRRLVRW